MALVSACSKKLFTNIVNASKVTSRIDIFHTVIRRYAKDDDCRRAIVDIPPKKDPVCPEPCERWSSRKPKFIHKIRMKILEGGSNFGTPFRRVRCESPDDKSPQKQKASGKNASKATKALPAPKKRDPPSVPEPRPGVQVSILGADMPMGQYLALLLKQCPTIKRLRLYEATMPSCESTRHIGNVAEDLQHINTNCSVQGFSCTGACQLERCLQNTDIVVMLESGAPNLDMSIEERFLMQAPKVKMYADAIATECPRAFLIVCVTPIDCMVPLVAQIFKETGWYNPKLLLGSMAVPEMRASTLAARALGLEPRYTRVPCIGGTEGEALVPLFSKAIEYFDFSPDKLLNKLEENEPELATSPEEECVICVNAKATMQTSPCGHRVVCRRCFVKTIQMAVSQRLLPLRCVICRAKILRLRQAPRLVTSKSWQVSSGSSKSWCVPGSVSSYSMGARSVPASASLYSVTSGESSISGVSSVSSNSGGVSGVSGGCSTKLCGGAKCGGACLGAVPRPPPVAISKSRQPASNSLRRSQHHSMKARLQEYQQVHSYTGGPVGAAGEPSGRLPPIREFQREFREGRRDSATANAVASTSTRIRCAQKIVTQLETSPQKQAQNFFRPLKPSNNEDDPNSKEQIKETEKKKDNPKAKPKKEDKKKKEEDNKKQDEKSKTDENSDNKKNETAERKREEKLRLKAEKEAKKEAKLQAKEEERHAKLLAKEEERQAKLLAKEEKKKAKKEAKLAAQVEKEKSK